MATRYLAQNALTRQWIDFDLDITLDAEQPRWELSGPGSLTGVLNGDRPNLREDGQTKINEWSTLIYQERDGRLTWCGIVQKCRFEAGAWHLEAYGVTSYANGYPYDGDYQKFVDDDPGVLWAAMWSHIQAQPDGNLGLRSVIPHDLGANIGTKDEPYELAWWESKDVGEELQQLASESPFDYVETHRWIGDAPSVNGNLVAGAGGSFRIGCGNFEGGYNGTDRGGWMKKRADKQAQFFPSLSLDLFVATELHEDTSSAMPQGADTYWLGLLRKHGGSDWSIARGYRGNQLIHRPSRVKVWATENRRVADPTGLGKQLRATSAWYVTHLPTGLTGWLFAGHFRVDQGGKDLERVRRAEASSLAAWANTHTSKPSGIPADVPDPMFKIILGDFNSYQHGSNDPMGLFDAAGYRDLQYRADKAGEDVPYGDTDTRSGKKRGRWIDNILTKVNEVDVHDVTGIPTHKLTDHALWVEARIFPKTPVLGVYGTGGEPRAEHVVTLSYPRAGRRRADLAFIQGDNVTEVVVFERDGAKFSNDVIVLGKGEGKKTIRGEDAVRDGRLRRPAVYTDKLASTTARCNSLAKRERGWRNLKPTVDSILVADHPNAHIGSWALGDDIYLQVSGVPNLGSVADWYRIMEWAEVTPTTARLTLTRSDAFTYGPTVEPPSDDAPDFEDPESNDDEDGA